MTLESSLSGMHFLRTNSSPVVALSGGFAQPSGGSQPPIGAPDAMAQSIAES
jgi:hypothetical protein